MKIFKMIFDKNVMILDVSINKLQVRDIYGIKKWECSVCFIYTALKVKTVLSILIRI